MRLLASLRRAKTRPVIPQPEGIRAVGARPNAAHLLGTAGPAVVLAAAPVRSPAAAVPPAPGPLPAGEPRLVEPLPDLGATYDLTAVVRPGLPRFEAGDYRVVFDWIGSRSAARPAPYTVAAPTPGDLNAAIAAAASPHLGGELFTVVTDLAVMGGHLYARDRAVGAYTLTHTP